MGKLRLAAAIVLTAAVSSFSAHVQAAEDTLDPAVAEELVLANRILADQNVLDGFGHVSLRDPKNPNRYWMSRSLAPALVTAGDLMEYDLDSNPIDAKGRTSFLERFIHGEIYKKRPDVKAVVHTHSAGVIPFSVSKVPLKPIFHTAAFLGAGAPVFEIRKGGGMTNMLVGNADRGKELAETLGQNSVALMRGHGDVVVAGSLPMAVFRAYYTDANARLLSQAIALGTPITYLAPEETQKMAKVLDNIHLRAWDLWKRAELAKDGGKLPAK